MTRYLLLTISWLFIAVVASKAQSITGKVANSRRQPVEGATVVLQAPDSSYLDASVTDANGMFRLNHSPARYRLIVQHLLYKTKLLEGTGSDAGMILLEPEEFDLDEVVVTAERPFVKVEDGRLEYDVARLARNRAVNNVYEALTKLPGVQEGKEGLILTGAGNITVVINGRPTTMDAGRLEAVLKNMPVDRVEKAEILYSAPPQYHARGAVINVVIKRSDDYSFQGEINAGYTNQYFNSGNVNGNFRLSTPETAFEVTYGANDIKGMEYMNIYSRHTLKDRLYEIGQNNRISSQYWEHQLRTAFEYNRTGMGNLDIAYTGSFSPDRHNSSRTTGNYQTSTTDKFIDTRLHNLSVHYRSETGLDIGGDYTRYVSDNEQALIVDYMTESRHRFHLSAGQKIHRYSVYADRSHPVAKGWQLGYGISYKFVYDHDFQFYNETSGDLPTQNTDSRLKEHTAGFYLSLGRKYETGLSFSASVTGEYYALGSYHKWAVYPQAALTYPIAPGHVFQFSLSTDKTYPGYWDMQSSVSYIDGYTELWGTPGLRPMTAYHLNGSYILKQKYIFGLFFTHTADFFAQTGYQSTERLALIYKNTNWDYTRLWGANAVWPLTAAGKRLESRLTLAGMRFSQRCDNFFDVPFDRKKWFFSGSLDNTFKIGKNLAFELNGSMQSPAIQGTFDIKSCYDLTVGLKWSFAGDKAILSMRCSDIFETGTPDLKIRFKGQYLDMDNAFYSRACTVHFTYRFGGYTKKASKPVDTSRFGMCLSLIRVRKSQF